MAIRIEPATSADLDSLGELLQQLFALEADFTFDPLKVRQGLERLLQEERACLLVARHEGKAVGLCSAQLLISTAEGAYSAWVEDVVVDRDHQGQGLGRRLLESIATWALKRGATRMQLLVDSENRPAQEFYSRLGWSRTQLIALRVRPQWSIREIMSFSESR